MRCLVAQVNLTMYLKNSALNILEKYQLFLGYGVVSRLRAEYCHVPSLTPYVAVSDAAETC